MTFPPVSTLSVAPFHILWYNVLVSEGDEEEGTPMSDKRNFVDPEDYPERYDIDPYVLFILDKALNRYNDDSPQFQAIRRICEDLDLCVKYGWMGHEFEWFFATSADAERHNEMIEEMIADERQDH